MPSYPQFLYPPPDFKCPYRDCCPYLKGLSTTWVFMGFRRAEEEYEEHLRITDSFKADLDEKNDRIEILERENAELKAKYKALHQQQFKANKKMADQPADDTLPEKIKKKRGAPTGHPGWVRPKPDHIDYTVNVPAPVVCPHCKSDKLIAMEEVMEHFQEDIAIAPRTIVTRYVHGQSFCKRCNRSVAQAGKGELMNSHIGPVAKSVAVLLRYRMGLPYRKTADLFRELFGLKFVPASAVGFDRKMASRGSAIYEDLRQKIRVADVVHADETSWRSDGLGHYVWFAGNKDLAYFQIDRHRSAAVAKTIFGENFEGILVRDRYAAYNGIGKQWQSCVSHILTKAKEINKEHELLPDKEKDAVVSLFCDRVIKLCKQLCDVGQKLKSAELPWPEAAVCEKRYVAQLKSISKQPLRFKAAETLRTHLSGPDSKNIFTFLRHPGVPPTNNHAEQSIRHMVIFRKICFGTRSESGLITHSVLPSLVQTARRQGVQPREFLQKLLTADTATAQAFLYNNSN